MKSIFRFKQFQVDQSNCAMKINTDGVLLGSMIEPHSAERILDIGTGTGVIAMMLAQKFPGAVVHGVEIDTAASRQAGLNFENSIFNNRLEVISGSFQDMRPDSDYDLIVSNPPFYTNSLHTPDARKTQAKHADSIFFESLIDFVDQNLSSNGRFYCVLPTLTARYVTEVLLPKSKLYYRGATNISSFHGAPSIRTVIQLGKEESSFENSELVIYASKGVYTVEYRELLKPYFLNF